MIQFDAIRLSGLTDIDLPILGGSLSEPFQIIAADGLGPPELELLLAETHAPGGILVNRRAQGREITIRIGLNQNYNIGQKISDLRYELYGLLSPSVDPQDQSVYVRLLSQNVPVVETQGYVKRIEIVPFDKKPQVQITISCLGPYLSRPDVTVVDYIPHLTSWPLTNHGRAPTGVEFSISFIENTPSFSIGVENGAAMAFLGDFLVGDKLIVDTNEATRFVGQRRGSEYVAYLELLTPESNWLTLFGGSHTIQTSNPDEFTWNYFRYQTRFWGV